MRSKELERLLGTADELVAARAQLARAEALEAEIARDRALVEQVPGLIAAFERCRGSIAELARELERQWVDQGPLVAAWQRASELEQLAAAAGVDGGEEQADAERARLQVETARLQTRELLVVLAERRCGLADAVLAAPFELPAPAPVRDDGRPEAGRRDALALIELADAAVATARGERSAAESGIATATDELEQLGGRQALAARVDQLAAPLPAEVELPESAPPSAAARLQRAGVRVTVTARA